MLPHPKRPTVSTHWGTYRAVVRDGALSGLQPLETDSDPSPISKSMVPTLDDALRIRTPAVRSSFLEKGHCATGVGRGIDPYVQVSWDEATALVAAELDRVRSMHGNEAIFGGSYGWSSAGRFHHAQSQVHRFLNTIGGYTRSISNYSYAAADAILPHILGDARSLVDRNTPWETLIKHTELYVMFGGAPHKNAQVNPGGTGGHILRDALSRAKAKGAQFVLVSPIKDDLLKECGATWLDLRPTTDVALMLGLAHTLLEEDLYGREFLHRFTVGYKNVFSYLRGETDGVKKDAAWASTITEIEPDVIRSLARDMARKRTMITMSWSLQRAEHGEQPYWMAITLAAMLGQIGIPGGGFGFGYGSINGIGNSLLPITWPSLPQGSNKVSQSIPVARIADALLHPGAAYDFNGEHRNYPDIRLVYWAGGNPFHHHQDLNRLVRAWRKPEAVIVHESWWNPLARYADIVLPAATQMERNDIACSNRDRYLGACHRLVEPVGEARDDYAIFTDLARKLGVEEIFTEGRDEEGWLRHFYGIARQRLAALNLDTPDFDEFWTNGVFVAPPPSGEQVFLSEFRANPEACPLNTPSGRIELFSEKISRFQYSDCLGHAAWMEPREWLGADIAGQFPLHLISNQPVTKLHSQLDHGPHSRSAKVNGREPLRIHPRDAEARSLSNGDIIRIFNSRGACLAAAVLSEEVRPGVVQMATGAWYDPSDPAADDSLEKHGNPNVLTADRGSSSLGQGTSAHSCLVQVERFTEPLPPITCFDPPKILPEETFRRRAF